MIEGFVDRVKRFLLEAREGYKIGRERFGIYWTVLRARTTPAQADGRKKRLSL